MKYLMWGAWLLFAVILLTVAGMMYWPYKPLRVDKVSVDKTQVCRGQEICFQFEGEKFMPIPVDALVELVDGYRYEIIKYTSNTPVGTSFKHRCFLVPYHIKPGQYQIVWSGAFEVNAFQTVRYKHRSEWIQVGR